MAAIAFIGAGRMASAMVHGLLKHNHFTPEAIGCLCGDDPSGPALAEKTGIRFLPDASELLADADTVVLACKPQQFADLDPAVADNIRGRLVISVLAGTTLARLGEKLWPARNIIRAMPNTPCQIGAGITAFAAREPLSATDADTVDKVLGSLGEVLPVPEGQLDAVTAVSGSGPAYVFEFAAALRAAAETIGLESEQAHRLALQTVIGAAQLMESSGTDPVDLRKAVTSPNGTTQAALESMEADGLRTLIEKAVIAARDRSIELAKL